MLKVIVTTGARLHFGLLAHAPNAPRRFGGVGLMVEQPGFQVSATRLPSSANTDCAAVDEYVGPTAWMPRVMDIARRCREVDLRQDNPGQAGVSWQLDSVIPAHVGLGSGTQLGLAVAQAWVAIQNILHSNAPGLDSTSLARLAGRGLRSALGIHGFHNGGLLVEAGKRSSDQISPVVARVDFPADWRIVLISPPNERGLSGTAEIAAFASLQPMSDAVSAALCRTVLLELLPAVHEADFDACSEALFQFGWLIGEYFAPAQGGVFASPRMATLVDWLRQRGIAGVGQSSWGPLLFALCPDE
ncbi:MAG: hypothetical protein JWM11_1635, partial [Planctomycetaceae bacterium]|nr:hypothetical protein [Planctomycetaceae bacterium]